MLEGNRKISLQNHIYELILGEGMDTVGRLKVSGSVLIPWVVTGKIEVDPQSEMVLVGVVETGRVLGDIKAIQVTIGVCQGQCDCIYPNWVDVNRSVEWNLYYDTLVMDEGANFMCNWSLIRPYHSSQALIPEYFLSL